MKQYARECILNRKDYIPGKPIEEVQKEFGITDIIKMASNENPMGTSPKAMEAMIEEVKTNSCRYPVSLCTELVGKLAKRLGVAENQIYIDNGGDAVITMYGLTFFNPDDEIVTADTTFPAYENITTKMGATIKKIPLTEGGYFDLPAMLKAVTEKTKTVFICSPNNPTGPITPKKDIIDFLEKVPSSTLVFLDEAYIDFVDNEDSVDSISLLGKYKNLVVMRTFSKVMGLAALRCGYCVADSEIVRAMMKAREPFPVNRIAQAGASAALDDTEFYEKTLANNREAKKYYYAEFDRMGLKYYPSESNFICVDLGADSEEVFNAMLRDGVIIRPLASQGLPTCARITFGLPEENKRTIASLSKALGK